MHISLIFHQVV